MPFSQPIVYDTIIAGAGPVGLFLACELCLAGVSVLVLEQAENPGSPLKALPFGMRGLSSTTLEALYRRGLLDDIEAARSDNNSPTVVQASSHWLQQKRQPGGHFAGIQFFDENVDSSRYPFRLPSPVPFNLAVDMQSLETLLAARAIALGAEIRRGIEVENLGQTSDRVIVSAGGDKIHSRWLVGCDGGRSTVRKAGGFDFVGTEPEFTGYSVLAELTDPDVLTPGRTYTATGVYTYAKPGVIAMVDFDKGALHRSQPITREHVQAVLRRISCTDVTLGKLRLVTTWTDRAYQVTAYRHGNVLLAGDAAHIHSPLGGQGLNLGLGDAMNLGWKLATTIRGTAPACLLDSYFAERQPEGARILDWSRAQVALMRPTPSTRALAAIIHDLIRTRDGATYFAERIWGVSLRYGCSGNHPSVGRSVPDFKFAGGKRVGGLLRGGKGLLLDFSLAKPLQEIASRWQGRFNYIASEVENDLGLNAVLVRPDGFVAWASEGEADGDHLLQAISQWFGEPDK